MYRQAKPYFVKVTGANECACPIHTDFESARQVMRTRIETYHKQSKCRDPSCLESDFFKMFKDSKSLKEILLCQAEKVPEWILGGVIPEIYKLECAEADCEDCGIGDEDIDDLFERKKMPRMPVCFAAAMHTQMEWEERRAVGTSTDAGA
jgi:hypothetical protein